MDDASRATWVYLMREKGETSELLRNFILMTKNQFGKNVKVVRSDDGSEFTSNSMKMFYQEQGILRQNSCVDTPQQNGMVERKPCHVLNVAQALLFQAHLPKIFWGECVLTAAHLINRTPSKLLLGKTPYEVIYGQRPSYDHIRVFGTLCFSRNTLSSKDKFESQCRKCLFVGYPLGHKG